MTWIDISGEIVKQWSCTNSEALEAACSPLIYRTSPCECSGRTECVLPTATGSLYGSLVWCHITCSCLYQPGHAHTLISSRGIEGGRREERREGVSLSHNTIARPANSNLQQHRDHTFITTSKNEQSHFLRSDCLVASFLRLRKMFPFKSATHAMWGYGSQCLKSGSLARHTIVTIVLSCHTIHPPPNKCTKLIAIYFCVGLCYV